jgi:metallo-beta-lactamase family protein
MNSLTHLGGEHCVTGSCHLLQVGKLNIMVDCGLSQGNDPLIPFSLWPIQPKRIDYLFLTHAHIDHIGRLPELIQNGFDGEIICSHPTKALLGTMLTDAMGFADLSEKETLRLLKKIDELSWGFEYGQEFDLKKGITFKLGRAGHILGSVFIRFEIPLHAATSTQTVTPEEAPEYSPRAASFLLRKREAGNSHALQYKPDSKNNTYTIIFSGDLGNKNTPILPDPDIPDQCDLLVLESTYGNRLHENRRERLNRLNSTLKRALADRGKVFIPAFALGRTQEILFELDRLFNSEEWRNEKIPVFVDSPLGLEITQVYSELASFWDKESQRLQQNGDHPFDFAGLYSVRSYQDHKELLDVPGPAIIIAGSGMCTGGRIIDHLIFGLSEPQNDVFFVGYQVPGTPGCDIVKYGLHKTEEVPFVYLKDQKTPIKANVGQLTGYSAHADQQGLIDWVGSMSEKPGAIKLVHGDPKAQKGLRDKLIKLGHNIIR